MDGESMAAIAALHKIDSRCLFVAGGRAPAQQNSVAFAAGVVAAAGRTLAACLHCLHQ
jgi:hypothetical protein